MSYVCDGCTKIVQATKEDPVVHTRLGRMHFECNRRAWAKEAGIAYQPPNPNQPNTQRVPLSVSPENRPDGKYKCGKCGGYGHNARSCLGPSTVTSNGETQVQAVGDETPEARIARRKQQRKVAVCIND